jgi:hypothetical protein
MRFKERKKEHFRNSLRRKKAKRVSEIGEKRERNARFRNW